MAPEGHSEFLCPKCTAVLPWSLFNTASPSACPRCRAPFLGTVFRAMFRAPESPAAGETILVDSESSCYYHAERKASVVCESCGRFLCSLCSVELGAACLCPACVESGRRKNALPGLAARRVLYDDVAVSLALLPLLVPFVGWACTLVPAPLAIGIAVRHWRTPSSLIHRTRIRHVLAILTAVPQVIAWTILFAWLAGR